MHESLEYLARGVFTEEPTLISDRFAEGFCNMLENKGCIQKSKQSLKDPENNANDIVDMKLFKNKLKRNEIDVEYLNQCLKQDNEYIMEGDDD